MSQDPNQGQQGARPLWTIGTVTDLPVLGPAGTYVAGKDIEVKFWDGSTEHLSYPKSTYDPETVRAAAQQAAERHLAVKALQGPMVPADVIAY